MNSHLVVQRSVSDQTAVAVRVAQRSQSIPIPIPKNAYQGGADTFDSKTPLSLLCSFLPALESGGES
jgi:hypothetical protein